MGVKTKKQPRGKLKIYPHKIPITNTNKKKTEQNDRVEGSTQGVVPVISFNEKPNEPSDMEQFVKEFSVLLKNHPDVAKDFLQRVQLRFRKNDTVRTLYQLNEGDKTNFVSLVISYMTKPGETGQPIKVKNFDQTFKDLKKTGKTFADVLITVLDSAFTDLRPHLM